MLNSNIVFITEREEEKKIKSNQSPWRTISKLVQLVTLRTLASKYNGQKRRTSASQARLCWLQRQLYGSGRGRVRWLISQADLLPPLPKEETSVQQSANSTSFGHKSSVKCWGLAFPGSQARSQMPKQKTSSSSGSWERRNAFRGSERLNVTKVQVQNEKHFPFFLLSEI